MANSLLPENQNGNFENILDLKAKIYDRENLVRNAKLMQDLVHCKSIRGLTKSQSTQHCQTDREIKILGVESTLKPEFEKFSLIKKLPSNKGSPYTVKVEFPKEFETNQKEKEGNLVFSKSRAKNQ